VNGVFSRIGLALAAVVFSTCAGGAFAAVPTKHEVLRAIAVIEKSVSSPEAADAAKLIVVYAQLSDDVMVDIGPDQLPWLGESWGMDREKEAACQSMLMAAFVAGNVKSQIKNDKTEDDTYSGWILAIDAYHRLRAKYPFRSPAIEALAKMQAEGKLLEHARDVHMKSEEEDSDTPRKPLAWVRPRSPSSG
jgi:hypothetical protein